MIDYWEAIGRLATYADLNKEFTNLKACTQQRKPKEILAQGHSVAGSGLVIDKEDFEEVQNFIKSVLTEQSLSLIAAGELIWDFSFPDSRVAMTELNSLIPKAKPELRGPTAAYFIALGRVIVDATLRKTLAATTSDLAVDWVANFPRLSVHERKQLFALTKNPKFIQLCIDFGRGPWDEGCIGSGSYYDGYIQPTGISAQPRNGRFFTVQAGTQWATAGAYNN